MGQIGEGTWLPLLRLSFQKYTEMPVDRCSKVSVLAFLLLLGISMKVVLFFIRDSNYKVSQRNWPQLCVLEEARWSFMFMLSGTVELKSASIAEAWVSASFPAPIPPKAAGCQWA